MVWTAASTPAMYVAPPPPPPVVVVAPMAVVQPSTFRAKFTISLRGRYRIFNAALYRFYEQSGGTSPAEGDTPDDTNATLPHEPTATHANAEWRFSLSYFNGCLDSGFYPVGARGETYQRLDVVGGAATTSPPAAPDTVELILEASGVVRVRAIYTEDVASGRRADTWAIAYTTNGSTPAEDSPTVTEAFTSADGLEQLDYALPAQSHGTTVKVRVQAYRSGDTTYSDGSSVLTETADAQGPAAPSSAQTWAGQLPEDL